MIGREGKQVQLRKRLETTPRQQQQQEQHPEIRNMRLVSTRHTAVVDVDFGGLVVAVVGGVLPFCLTNPGGTMWPRPGLLHRGAQPGSCTARPRRPDMTRIIAVTGAMGREEAEEGVWTGRMLRREARISSLQTAVRTENERGEVGGVGSADGLQERAWRWTRTQLKLA